MRRNFRDFEDLNISIDLVVTEQMQVWNNGPLSSKWPQGFDFEPLIVIEWHNHNANAEGSFLQALYVVPF